MPLTFPSRAPVDESRRYSAMQIEAITIDNRTLNLLVEVVYGDMVNGKFKRNHNVSGRTFALGALEYEALGKQLPPQPTAGMYNNVKQLIWGSIIAQTKETGTVE